MTEITILSKVEIKKDEFISSLDLKNFHFELGGNNDQLWLINDLTDSPNLIINLDQDLDEVDKLIVDEFKLPYKGFIYDIEFNDEEILKKLLANLNNESRDLYYSSNIKFKKVK